MSKDKQALVLVRGGGDLATGVALRLHRAGIKVVVTELAQPLAVRRTVSFSEAVYEGHHTVEGVTARLMKQDQTRPEFYRGVQASWDADEIPIIVDPEADILTNLQFTNYQLPVVVDARLIKTPPHPFSILVPLHIGLGPGFHAGRDCHAVIETRRSHTLGRVYWTGTTQPDSGEPEGDPRRVLRAPSDGVVTGLKKIGEHCEEGEVLAEIHSHVILSEAKNLNHNQRDSSPAAQSDIKIVSPFAGMLRGIIRDGLRVTKGMKIGDVDPRDDPSACYLVSDKALAIGGGALEAILSREEIRRELW